MDYSSILMQAESKMKSLSAKCLNRKYEGFAADIASIHSDLTLLAMWIAQEQMRQIEDRKNRSKA